MITVNISNKFTLIHIYWEVIKYTIVLTEENTVTAQSLLGIHLGDFFREELVYPLIDPSHEAVLIPILRWSTVDLLKEKVEESHTMSGPSDKQ